MTLTATDIPEPTHLMFAPELAALRILDVALETASNALWAAYPELYWEEYFVVSDPAPNPALLRTAERIIGLAEDLQAELAGYRPPPPRPDQLPLFDEDPDVPF